MGLGRTSLSAERLRVASSSRRDEINQALPIVRAQLLEAIAARGSLPSMPQDGLFDAPRPAVVQVADLRIDAAQQTQAPQRCCSPLLGRSDTLRIVIGKLWAHVM